MKLSKILTAVLFLSFSLPTMAMSFSNEALEDVKLALWEQGAGNMPRIGEEGAAELQEEDLTPALPESGLPEELSRVLD